jgi:osmotically-inducible protein OsmY
VLVEDTVVTLVGSVPSVDQREKALEIARNTPGVASVRSRLRVNGAQQVT